MQEQKPFDGMTFVFTGQLEDMSGAAARDAARELGGTVSGEVGPSTDYVIEGAVTGRRKTHALLLGIPILDEAGWMKLLEEAGWQPEKRR